MNVSLTPRLEELIRKRMASGLYSSASEVVREALRLLEDQDRVRDMKLKEIRLEVLSGIEQLDQGKSSTFDESTANRIKKKGHKMLASSRRKKSG